MKLKTKAFINSIRLRRLLGEKVFCKDWQVEDLRYLSAGELLDRLHDLGLELDKEELARSFEMVDSPEGLCELLCAGFSQDRYERAYLLLFELWRKLSGRQTPSIFGDELDYRIFLYDSDEFFNDDLIQTALFTVEELLQKNVDAGATPKEAFLAFQKYLAHDLESFLYDYIHEQIENRNLIYAGELIESFYNCMSKPLWFDFLFAYLYLFSDIENSNDIIKMVVNELLLHPDFDLQMEVLRFMSRGGDGHLFLKLARTTLAMVGNEGELKDLLEIAAEYYRRFDRVELEQSILYLMQKRLENGVSRPVDRQDPDLAIFSNYLV